jgi:hypothetical protein
MRFSRSTKATALLLLVSLQVRGSSRSQDDCGSAKMQIQAYDRQRMLHCALIGSLDVTQCPFKQYSAALRLPVDIWGRRRHSDLLTRILSPIACSQYSFAALDVAMCSSECLVALVWDGPHPGFTPLLPASRRHHAAVATAQPCDCLMGQLFRPAAAALQRQCTQQQQQQQQQQQPGRSSTAGRPALAAVQMRRPHRRGGTTH